MDILPLRAALTRGALLLTANWPVAVIDFAVGSLCRLAVSVPVFGGSLVVATLVGTDPQAVVGEGIRATADNVMGSLASSPGALTAFLAALAIVAVGGEAILSIVRMGTFSVVVEADRRTGEVEALPIGAEAIGQASHYRLETVLDGALRFRRPAIILALWLGVGYAVIGLAYVLAVTGRLEPGFDGPLGASWPLVVLGVTALSVMLVAGVRLACDLLRVVVVTDACQVSTAFGRLRAFAVEDARQVIGIFLVMGLVQVVAAIVALLAAAGLAIVSYVPLVGLVFVPLQAAAWVLRGLLFESLALAALAACQTQYRRFSRVRFDAGR